ncbi:MAG TPA: hypothetical protein VIJ47_10575 [Acidimicrobiales bacterium]
MAAELPDSSDPAETSARTARAVPGVGPRWRRVLVYALAVLTCFSILTASVGVWAHRTLLNTDSWVNAVGPLASNPQVTDAVAKEVTTQLLTLINAQELAQNALPDKAKVLAAPLTEAVGQFVERTVAELLRTDQFQTFWVEANRRVHSLAVKVLRGDTKLIRTDNGTVSLNLLPLLADALRFIQGKAPGLLGSATTIPDITFDTPPDQARKELETAVGRTAPENFGVITVFQSDKLKAAQDAVSLFDKLTIGLVVAAVVLFIATVALALDRRRILIVLGLGTVVAIALAAAVINAIRGQVLGMIANPEYRGAVSTTVTTLVTRLRLITDALVVVGLAMAVIAFLTGGSRLAVAIRRETVRGFRALTGPVDPDSQPKALVWLQAHVNQARWAGAVLGVLALFVIDGWWGLFFTLLIVGLYEAALAYLATRRPALA